MVPGDDGRGAADCGAARRQPVLGLELGRRQGLSLSGRPLLRAPSPTTPAPPTCATRSPRARPRRSRFLATPWASPRGCGCSTSGADPGRHVAALAGRGLDVVGVDISVASCGWSGRAARWPGRRPSAPAAARRRSTPPSRCARAGSGCSAARRTKRCSANWRGRSGRVAGSAVIGLLRLLRGAVSGGGRRLRRRHRGQPRADRGPQTRRASRASFDLWTTCFTPRELRLLAGRGRPASVRACGRSAPGLRGPPTRPRSPGVSAGRGRELGSTMRCHLSRWLRNSCAR